MKKKNFIRFLYKKLIAAVLLTGLAFVFCYPFYYTAYKAVKIYDMSNVVDSVEITLVKNLYEYGETSSVYKHTLSSHGSGYLGMTISDNLDVALMLVDKDDNMKQLATSEETSIMVYNNEENGDSRLFVCANDNMRKVYERNIELDQWVVTDGIYVDGDVFYPGVVKIVDKEAYIYEQDINAEVIESWDFTPENAEDYEYLTGSMFCFNNGTPKDSRAMKFLTEHYINRNPDYTDEEVYYDQYNIYAKGKNYKLYIVCGYVYPWIGEIVYAALIMFILFVGIIVSFAMASREYRKYRTQYEVDEFRRSMTSSLAHDLKTPLTAIMGYAENLKENVHNEKKDYYAQAVMENAAYMNNIITSTLDLAKLDMQDGIKYAETDITAIASELVSKYRTGAEDRGIKITLEGKGRVKADKLLISRALENLISNAVKYTADNGEIRIKSTGKAFVVENTCDHRLKGGTDEFCKPFFKADESGSERKNQAARFNQRTTIKE